MRSTFKVLFYVNRTKLKADGTVPIMCRITINGTMAQFSCKLSVDPVIWDVRTSQAHGTAPAVKRINREITTIRKGIEKHYRKTFNSDDPINAGRVKESYLGLEYSCLTILQVFNQHNEDYLKLVEADCRSLSSYRNYCTAYNHLSEYINSEHKRKDIALAALRYNFITGFERFLRKRKQCVTNTILHYVIPLRKMITISQDNGWITNNPFSGYLLRKEKSERGYLTIREINLLIKAQYASKRHEMIRDCFIFCCFTGVPHADVRLLTMANVKEVDGKWWLYYSRQKTNVPCHLRLLDIPLSIIRKYSSSRAGDTLFHLPTPATVNRTIKTVTQLAGIEKDVTWHQSRHSFATEICFMNGVPIESISRMLGHTDIKTTQIYTRISDTVIDRDMSMLSEKLNRLAHNDII